VSHLKYARDHSLKAVAADDATGEFLQLTCLSAYKQTVSMLGRQVTDKMIGVKDQTREARKLSQDNSFKSTE
jgi:hypothetical protein